MSEEEKNEEVIEMDLTEPEVVEMDFDEREVVEMDFDESGKKIFCMICGNSLPTFAKFCNSCGFALKSNKLPSKNMSKKRALTNKEKDEYDYNLSLIHI